MDWTHYAVTFIVDNSYEDSINMKFRGQSNMLKSAIYFEIKKQKGISKSRISGLLYNEL